MTEPTLNYVHCPGAAANPTAPSGGGESGHRMAYWEWNGTGDPAHPHVVVCVHGLTRQGRDFDVLARRLSRHARVVCPDVAGRGHSDWLADPACYQVPVYAGDMLALLHHLHAQAPLRTLDWVGTSMGGLIGMALCGQPDLPLPVPVRRLVLNDVGPALEWTALQRIGQYVGKVVRFGSAAAAVEALRVISAGFGPHTPQEWLALSEPMLRPLPDGACRLHYDPAIAEAFRSLTPEIARAADERLWQLYDHIRARTLVLRGADSDLLVPATVQAMAQRGPRARVVEWQGVGHAPTLVASGQVDVVEQFLFGEPAQDVAHTEAGSA
ncbi:alpha/beta fold hydrolase [Acidovorax sp. NCPPB 4044]|uniref:alpha/beta fold hydrolase n=1 Tax=Acidovorax sp. NCPPB 4044 TaxID=2940490 RepID=UPI002303D317|nr:alpha/beta hydrolase [Acidovorax sp. NCPPB 4044]MDA8520123.1 alpha/beta hydrolase [Acidovorax sp. NCPPB 4044]